jgi:hypothetical protein
MPVADMTLKTWTLLNFAIKTWVYRVQMYGFLGVGQNFFWVGELE